MARYQRYDDAQLVRLPVAFERQRMPGTLEIAIHELGQRRVDTASFKRRDMHDTRGCSAYDPKL
jgi:hypothetical protein